MNEYKQRDDVRLEKIIKNYSDIEKEFIKRFVTHSVDNPPQIEKSSRIDEIARMDKLINSIKDPEDKKIAMLKLEGKLTVRQISERLNKSKSTVQDRWKKIKAILLI